jgi:DNA-binding NtrC family response regulator
VILAEHLPIDQIVRSSAGPSNASQDIGFGAADLTSPAVPVSEDLDAVPSEKERIIEALKQSAGNQTRCAELLGISRRTLVSRLDKYGLPRPRKP